MSSRLEDRPTTNGHRPRDPEVRTYRGKSLEEILPRIRAELGPDAVIVRQRDGLMGGIGGFFQQQFVEVEARAGARRFDAYDDGPALPPALGAGADGAAGSDAASAPRAAPPRAAAPTDAGRPAAAPAAADDAGRRLTAAELLARATGADVNDPRTPAEILREQRAAFARQLAAAEARVAAPAPAQAPAPAAAREASAAAVPARPADGGATAPADDRAAAAPADDAAPAAARPAAPRAAPATPAPAAAAPPGDGDPAPAPRARPSRRRRAARARRTERTAARAGRTARAARADATARADARAARADATARADARAARADPAAEADAPAAPPADDADRGADEPAGVGPQTAQALELAAIIAQAVARGGATAAADPVDAPEPPAAPPAAAGDGAAAPRRPAPAPRTRPPAGRRGILGRRRAAAIPLARVVASPAAARVTDALEQRGVAAQVARDVIVDAAAHVLPFAADGDLRAAARVALARRIPTPEPPRLGGRAVAFVGTGGAGKTRCVAGLAAAYAGASTVPVVVVALAPADGGAELRALLREHGVRVEPFADGRAAARRIAEARGRSLVVIDTPAVPIGDERAIAALAAQLAPLELDEIQLTLPATLSAPVAREQLQQLAPLGATGIAMTHADATDHIGAVVELACATRLPLAYVNSGLALPGALAPADPAELAERLLA